MRKFAVTTLAAGAIVASLASVPTASAAPSTTGLDGAVCTFVSVADPTAEPGTQTGWVLAGPALIDDGAFVPGVHSGSFICTVQVGPGGSTHVGSDAAVVVGPTTTAVIGAEGTLTYTAGVSDVVYVCTEIVVDGTHLYFNDPNNGLGGGSFDTAPGGSCGKAAQTVVHGIPVGYDYVQVTRR
ncbi:MAG: hypothetical protein QOE45_856 [Frankiaceae bacterium]|jgi:hypothetical protein|nr:hypothetical protein [Frankiaceae bacterium]